LAGSTLREHGEPWTRNTPWRAPPVENLLRVVVLLTRHDLRHPWISRAGARSSRTRGPVDFFWLALFPESRAITRGGEEPGGASPLGVPCQDRTLLTASSSLVPPAPECLPGGRVVRSWRAMSTATARRAWRRWNPTAAKGGALYSRGVLCQASVGHLLVTRRSPLRGLSEPNEGTEHW